MNERDPRILMVATKAPWPPVDGGRLLLWRTLRGLAAAGVRPTLVVPVTWMAPLAARPPLPPGTQGNGRRGGDGLAEVTAALAEVCEPVLVAARPVGLVRGAWRSLAGGVPVSIARHSLAGVRRRVAEVLAGGGYGVVHAEQLQALPQVLGPARRRRVPVVLRAQNVESALWTAAARGAVQGVEAWRLARWEGAAVGRVAMTAALTALDAAALRGLAAGAGAASARVEVVPAPFEAELPPGAALAGDPALTLLGSRGWRPNEDAVAWFLAEIWPAVRRALPGARLHVFGIEGAPGGVAGERGNGLPAVSWHGAPVESAEAFAAGSIHVVPLRIGSGVRMKVLEAWARGVPVVTTPEGAAGLEAVDGVEVMLARDGASFAVAVRRLREEPGLAAALVRGGRAALRARHDPAAAAARLLEVYAEVADRRGGWAGDRAIRGQT